jgi:hypothetical protein
VNGIAPNPTFLAVSLGIVAASAAGLWWLLRGESRGTLLLVALLSSGALTLRLAYPTDYPSGLNEDEPKVLYAAGRAIAQGDLLAESNISVPILPHALFQGQLIFLFGPGRWAIRAYSLVGGVLCTPAAFAAARALQLAVAPSLAVAGLIAVLPWSLFYSRVMTGTELTFFELLLIAALARLVFAPVTPPASATGDQPRVPSPRPPAPAWLLGSFALTWLLFGYWCTRSMVGMPIVAAALARGRRRWWCLGILLVALALYAPYVAANRGSNFVAQGVNPTYYANFGDLGVLARRTWEALTSFVRPVAEDGWLTIRSAAMHPPLLLLIAALGALTGVRRGIFLLAGFFGGLAPGVLAWGPPSTHRMLMAFPFVALAAGCALHDLVVWRRARVLASVALVAAVGWWSVRFYFSDAFWPLETRWTFDPSRTAVIESLPVPPAPQVVFMRQITFFRDPRRLLTPSDAELAVENWFPGQDGGIYVFTFEAAPLRAFYDQLFGPKRVEVFGATFKVTLEPGDWSWLRQHGWSYEWRCAAETRRGQVPTLYQMRVTFVAVGCDQENQHTWRGRWVGPPTPVRLRITAPAVVQAGTQRFDTGPVRGDDVFVDFVAEPGMDIRIDAMTPRFQPWIHAALFERTPAGERVPPWDRVVPAS